MLDIIQHPGHYVQTWLRINGMSQAQLATALNCKEPFVSKIVRGRAHISPKIAIKLEAVTRIPAQIWMGYETEYQLHRARGQFAERTVSSATARPSQFPAQETH